MVKTNIYCVLDSKAGVYGVPFFMPKDGMAIRAIADLANDINTMVGKHPEDYTLYRVGEFNDETAEIESVAPNALCTASSLVRAAVVDREVKEISLSAFNRVGGK